RAAGEAQAGAPWGGRALAEQGGQRRLVGRRLVTGVAGRSRALLLERVGELVSQQDLARERVRPELAGREVDVPPEGRRWSIAGEGVRVAARVQVDRIDRGAEAAAHALMGRAR